MNKFTRDFERLARIKDVRLEDGFPEKAKSSQEVLDQTWKKIRGWEKDHGLPRKNQEESDTLRIMKSLAGIDFRAMWTEGEKKKKPTMPDREYVSGQGNKSLAGTRSQGTGSGDEYEEPDPDGEYETDDEDDLDYEDDDADNDGEDDDEECDPDEDEDCEDEDDDDEDEDEDYEEAKKCSTGKDCGCGCKGPLGERQKDDPALAFPDEDMPARKGAFKISSKALRLWKAEVPEMENPTKALFVSQRKVLDDIPRDDLPKLFGKNNMPDAQDFVAHRPRKAFQMMMTKAKTVSPKLHRLLSGQPSNASLYFYGILLRVSGKDMADIILKRYFHTDSDHPGTLNKKSEDEEGVEEAFMIEAAPKGKAQEVIMAYLKASKAGVSVELTDIARDPGLRGSNFKSVMSAAEALAKKKLVSMKGSTISLLGKMESVTDSMSSLLERRRMRGGRRPIARKIRKAMRW